MKRGFKWWVELYEKNELTQILSAGGLMCLCAIIANFNDDFMYGVVFFALLFAVMILRYIVYAWIIYPIKAKKESRQRKLNKDKELFGDDN